MTDLAYYQDLARRLVEGKKLILPGGVLARAGQRLAPLRLLGAERPLLLASNEGTGEQPTTEDAEWFILGVEAPSVIEDVRETDRALCNLSQAAVAAIDAYDPDREAIALGGPLVSATSIAGRRVIGGRPSEWTALEDKVVVDEIWDAAGVPRAPSEIAPANKDALTDAAKRIDRGDGTVWAGDASEGFNGGADYVRWVRRAHDVDEAASFFGEHCRSVRVMPMLDGIPTSMHGFVHRGDVAVFRPVELLTLRTPTNRFKYSGVATYWDPPSEGREEMRDVARRVGAELERRVSYRGGFTVDGVMTAEGFRPTELNARFGAGIVPLLGSLMLPLGLIQTIAVDDPNADLRPVDLERIVLEHADSNRGGSCYATIPQKRTGTETHRLADDDGFSFAEGDDEGIGTLSIGPSAIGGLVSYQPDAPKMPLGPSFAPTAVRVFAFADNRFSTELGPLEAATPVR